MTGQTTPARRRGGRPAQVNEQDIVRAAIAVIDDEGLEALTMRRLATQLGVTAMSLYRHLSNRDAVLSAVVDHLAGQAVTATDPRGSWRQAVQGFAEQYRAVLLRHPRVVPLLATHPVTMDTGLALIEPVLHRCQTAGVGHDQALTVIQSVTVYTLGHALAQVGTAFGTPAPAAPGADGAEYYQRWYDAGLKAMLDGFQARLTPGPQQ